MYKYILSALVAFAFILSSCADSSSPTSSVPNRPSVSDNAMQHETYEETFRLWNSCCEEWVYFTGTVHTSWKDGKYHWNYSNLTGTTDDGDIYRGGATMNTTRNFDYNGAGEYTSIENVVLSSSSGCKMTIKIRFHFTIDANGVPHADIDVEEVECFE